MEAKHNRNAPHQGVGTSGFSCGQDLVTNLVHKCPQDNLVAFVWISFKNFKGKVLRFCMVLPFFVPRSSKGRFATV